MLDGRLISLEIIVIMPKTIQTNVLKDIFSVRQGFFEKEVYVCQDDLYHISQTLMLNNQNDSKIMPRFLPRNKADPIILKEDAFRDYKDELEIYDMYCGENIDKPSERIREEAIRFLSGEKAITPETIYLNSFDKIYAIRDVIINSNTTLIRKINEKIDYHRSNSDDNERSSAFSDYIFKIFHEPSAGGTTVGKLLLHSFR